MKSIGEGLISARERRHLSVEQAARDTHIAKHFIESLEQEKFEVFPAESYLIGFLRRYCLYLDLDADKMISLFKNTLVQEQESPVNELLNKKQTPPKNLALIVLSLIIISSIIAAITIIILTPRPEPAIIEPEFRLVSFSTDILEQEFEPWTSVELSINNNIHTLNIQEVSDPLELYINENILRINIDEVEFIDFDADTSPDLRVVYKSRLNNGNPVLRLDRAVAGSFEVSSGSQEDRGPINAGATNEPSRERSVVPITTLVLPQPFTVRAEFRGPVNFRYQTDSGERVEEFYNNGENFEIEVRNYIYFWISNAGKLDFTVNNQNIRLGTDGSVTAFRIGLRERLVELTPLY